MLQLSFVQFRKDSYILVEGNAVSDRFYIIQSGHVKVMHQNEFSEMTAQVLGPGDFIGVISCMSQRSQIERVIALSDVVCIAVRREQYPELIEKNTPVALKIIRTFAHRMRILNEVLMIRTLKNASSELPSQMLTVAEYYDSVGQYSIACFAYYQFLKSCRSGADAEKAAKRFNVLRNSVKPVYLEPNHDLVRAYPAETMVFSEAQPGSDMFVIQEGTVKITKIVDGTEMILAVLKKGDMVGEMALLENKPRSASAIAKDACRLMTINRMNFNQMVVSQPQLIARLTTTLAERLWAMHRQLTNTLLAANPLARMTDMLSLQVEKTRIEFHKGMEYQTSLSVEDIATMCGLKKGDRERHLYNFMNSSLIRIVNGTIFVPDCLELIKQSEFYRKQIARGSGVL